MNLYVLAAIAFLVVGGYAGIEHYRAEAAETEVTAVSGERDRANQRVREQEEESAKARARQAKADDLVKTKDARIALLEKEKRGLRGELDGIRKTLPKEDQDCLTRALPDAFAERLRLH